MHHKELDGQSHRIFEALIAKVKNKFNISRKETSVGLKLLTRFDALKEYRSLFIHHVTEFKGERSSFILILVEKHFTIIDNPGKRMNAYVPTEKEIEEVEPMLLFSIPHDMDRVYIKPENLADKLTDLFVKVDIDFIDHPDFSKNYYVIANKPETVLRYLPKGLMTGLGKVKDMTVEINGQLGLLRSWKNLSEHLLLELLGIGYEMTK
jgi:hypothetical protein